MTNQKAKILRLISGSILNSYTTLFYLEELQRTKKPKQRLKNLLNQVIRELQKYEKIEFDFIDGHDKDSHLATASDEVFWFFDSMLNNKDKLLESQLDYQRFHLAYASDPKNAMKGVEEVLNVKEKK